MKKAVIAIAVVLVALITLVFTLPFLFKDKINARVKEEINAQLNATVNYDDFGLSLIRTFPNFSFSLHQLSVAGKDDFKGDTLLQVENFRFTIDLMSVLKGEKYKLIGVNINKPRVHAIVNYKGKANWDILKPSKTPATAGEPSKNFDVEIGKTIIGNAHITYDDRLSKTYAEITGLNFEGKGDVSSNIYDFATKTTAQEVTYKSGNIAYLSKARLNADVNLKVDNINNKYTLTENSLSLNDLGLALDGFVQTKKSETNLDLKFRAKETTFKSILSLLPAIYKKDFDKVKTAGTLALDGFVKGTYSETTYPGFGLNVKISNGMFQYPDLPVPVKNIQLSLSAKKPQGSLDLTVVDIPKFHLEAGTEPVDGFIYVRTPISNPDVKAGVHGKLDLANVPKFYPIEGLKKLSGTVLLDVDFKGTQRDLNNKNYQAVSVAGITRVSNLVYESTETPMPIRVSNLQMSFNPSNVTLSNFSARIGRSDFNANGTLDNFMAYIFGTGDLLGQLNMRSAVFDANEWLQKDQTPADTKTSADTSTKQYFKVPDHIDFTASAEIGKLFYDKLVLENVKGNITVRDEKILLSNLFANLLGGNATISARYDTKGLDHPDVTFSYDINNFDIQQTYKAVELSDKLAPVMKFIQGSFSSDMSGEGRLNKDMSVDYNSLTGDGKVEIPSARIVNMPVLTEITKVARIPALQNLEIKNGWTILRFKNGKVNVEPTDVKFGNGYNMNFKGTNGFDKTIDYDMRLDVPSKELGPATGLAQNMLSKVPGVNASMPEIVGFLFKVTGTADKPQVKLQKVLAGGSSVKDVVNNAAADLKQKAEDEARKRAEEIKKQADAELQKQKQAAEEAARKAKEDAERKAKEAADKLRKEAEEKAKGIFKWPR